MVSIRAVDLGNAEAAAMLVITTWKRKGAFGIREFRTPSFGPKEICIPVRRLITAPQ